MTILSALERFVTACRQSKFATFYLFCLFAFSLFLQCVMFHWAAYHSIPLTALWKSPLRFWTFYVPKLSLSICIAAFVFLTRRKYWTIVFSILLNIWILAEVIYYRSTRIFISAYSILLLGNMDGFWGCIPMYMDAAMLLLLIPTCLTILGVYLFGVKKRNFPFFGLALFIGLLLDMESCHLLAIKDKVYFSGLQESFLNDTCGWDINHFVAPQLSVLHALLYDTKQLMAIPFQHTHRLSADEQAEIAPLTRTKGATIEPQTPLVLILVESMETWAIRPDITPNLSRFIDRHPSVLHATRVQSQTKGGNSGDGQMIFNTGLLPVAEGAACNRFSNNVFPSLSDLYDHTAMIQAGSITMWNQGEMNSAYHIDSTFFSPDNLDARTFFLLDSIATRYDYILAITMATHAPFDACAKLSRARNLPTDMPTPMANYLHSMHYTDSCWGAFLQRIDTDSVLRNSTIAIMGDHIIFNADQRQEFQSYCDAAGQDFAPREAYTALVVYSPVIQEKTVIDTPTYQMDAYPTLLHLIGGEAYYWQGFGVNLLDTAARTHRPIEVNRAYQLSDRMIQADYFR